MGYTQEQQNQILSRINAGVIGKRKQADWDRVANRTIYTKKIVTAIAKKYKYYNDFQSENNGAYAYATRYGYLEQITKHMLRTKTYHINDVKKLAKLCESRLEFFQKYEGEYQWALRNGKLDLLFKKHINQVSKETIYTLAKTCKNRTELSNKKFSYYQRAKKEGWLKEWFPKK